MALRVIGKITLQADGATMGYWLTSEKVIR